MRCRFLSDIEVLAKLTAIESTPTIPIQALNYNVLYIIGDASGPGFGSQWWFQNGTKIDAQFGQWKFDVSNFWESVNIVNSLRIYLKSGKILPGMEVFIYTDNIIAKSTYFKGSSKYQKLHKMIVELKLLEMEGQIIVQFLCILGRRIISQDKDGFSRGDLSLGVMQGEEFLNFLPLNETALEQQEDLKNKIRTWLKNLEGWIFTNTDDWFHKVFFNP